MMIEKALEFLNDWFYFDCPGQFEHPKINFSKYDSTRRKKQTNRNLQACLLCTHFVSNEDAIILEKKKEGKTNASVLTSLQFFCSVSSNDDYWLKKLSRLALL